MNESHSVASNRGEEQKKVIDYAQLTLADDLREQLLPVYSAKVGISAGEWPRRTRPLKRRFHQNQFEGVVEGAEKWRDRAAIALPYMVAARHIIAEAFRDELPTVDALATSTVEEDSARMTPLLLAKAVTATAVREKSRHELNYRIEQAANGVTTGRRLRDFYSGILARETDANNRQEQIIDVMVDVNTNGHDFAEMLWVYDALHPEPEEVRKGFLGIGRGIKQNVVNSSILYGSQFMTPNDSNSIEKLLIIAQRTGDASLIDKIIESPVFHVTGDSSELQIKQVAETLAIVRTMAHPIAEKCMSLDRAGLGRSFEQSFQSLSSLIARTTRQSLYEIQERGVSVVDYIEYAESVAQLAAAPVSSDGVTQMLQSESEITVDTAARMIAVGTGDIKALNDALQDTDSLHKLIIGYNILLALRITHQLHIEPATAMAVEHRFRQMLNVDADSVREEIDKLNQRFAAYVNTGDVGLEDIDHLREIIEQMPTVEARGQLNSLLSEVLEQQRLGTQELLSINPAE